MNIIRITGLICYYAVFYYKYKISVYRRYVGCYTNIYIILVGGNRNPALRLVCRDLFIVAFRKVRSYEMSSLPHVPEQPWKAFKTSEHGIEQSCLGYHHRVRHHTHMRVEGHYGYVPRVGRLQCLDAFGSRRTARAAC